MNYEVADSEDATDFDDSSFNRGQDEEIAIVDVPGMSAGRPIWLYSANRV